VSIDPANPVAYNNLGILYREAGQHEKALWALEMARSLSPTFGGLNYEIGAALLLAGDARAALDAFEAEGFEAFSKIGRSMALFSLGDEEQSSRLLAEVIESHADLLPFYIAQVYAFRGQLDAAFQWLGRAKAAEDVSLYVAIFDPLLANLHPDARWLAFLSSLQMAPDQLRAVDFDLQSFSEN
jgi:tetratricopeptide (TPR) repeat protein